MNSSQGSLPMIDLAPLPDPPSSWNKCFVRLKTNGLCLICLNPVQAQFPTGTGATPSDGNSGPGTSRSSSTTSITGTGTPGRFDKKQQQPLHSLFRLLEIEPLKFFKLLLPPFTLQPGDGEAELRAEFRASFCKTCASVTEQLGLLHKYWQKIQMEISYNLERYEKFLEASEEKGELKELLVDEDDEGDMEVRLHLGLVEELRKTIKDKCVTLRSGDWNNCPQRPRRQSKVVVAKMDVNKLVIPKVSASMVGGPGGASSDVEMEDGDDRTTIEIEGNTNNNSVGEEPSNQASASSDGVNNSGTESSQGEPEATASNISNVKENDAAGTVTVAIAPPLNDNIQSPAPEANNVTATTQTTASSSAPQPPPDAATAQPAITSVVLPEPIPTPKLKTLSNNTTFRVWSDLYTKENDSYICTVCKFRYSSRKGFVAHYEVDHLGIRFECKTCGKTLGEQRTLRTHEARCSLEHTEKENATTTSLEESKSQSQNNTTSATSSKSDQENIVVPSTSGQPGAAGTAKAKRRIKLRSKSQKRMATPRTAQSILNGTGRTRGRPRRTLNEGSVTTSTPRYRYSVDKRTKRIRCGICGKEYVNRVRCHQHFKKMHLGVQYKCNLCNKSFSNKNTLRIHQNSCSLFRSVGKMKVSGSQPRQSGSTTSGSPLKRAASETSSSEHESSSEGEEEEEAEEEEEEGQETETETEAPPVTSGPSNQTQGSTDDPIIVPSGSDDAEDESTADEDSPDEEELPKELELPQKANPSPRGSLLVGSGVPDYTTLGDTTVEISSCSPTSSQASNASTQRLPPIEVVIECNPGNFAFGTEENVMES